MFFKKYLAEEIKKPQWSPAIMTINDLFLSLSRLQLAENELLLFELYKVYRKTKQSYESFDDFYFWGDMILNDFDDIDKYLVDASQLFRNVQNIKKIDEQFGGLSQEQADIVKRFWMNIDTEKLTNQKSEFLSIWSILNELYNEFKRILIEKKIAYEGLIFRDVIEKQKEIDTAGINWEIVHFIGFNAMNTCEKNLMLRLKNEGRARFYWDYDNSYIQESNLNSAGYFLRNNIRLFGNDMPPDWSYDTLLSRNPSVTNKCIINTSSDIAQVKLLPELIRKLPAITSENAHQTAIILADENLLIPLLTSLPEDIADINITMGYPLKQTSLYILVKQILDLQLNARNNDGVVLFNYQDVMKILKNTFIRELAAESGSEILLEIDEKNLLWIPSERFQMSAVLSLIFKKPSSPALITEYLKTILSMINSDNEDQLDAETPASVQREIRNEFIYRIILSLNRLDAVAKNPEINLTADTWTRILDKLLRLQSVPFSGEPLCGIQIMGILETRTLDFKNIIILSVNEGTLPAVTTASSFIPFSLREAFGLPSINHQESIYAYHFYRLLHRAENVTFIYNSDSEGLRSGEMSRFLQQMRYEPALTPEFLNMSYEIKNFGSISQTVERTEDHNQRLLSRFSGDSDGKMKYISPSAINTWLNCRMRFYYRYVNDLDERDKISEEIDPARLGTILHAAIKDLYIKFRGRLLDSNSIDTMSGEKGKIAELISNAIREHFKRDNDSDIAGNELIINEVIMVFIERILRIDKAVAPITIVSFEDPVVFPITIRNENNIINLRIGGRIDRVDILNGTTRIIDYKTGKTADSIGSLGALFEDDRDKDLDGWLQTLIYCEGYMAEKTDVKVIPSIYKLKKIPGEQLSEKLKIKGGKVIEDYREVRKEFLEYLTNTVEDIFSIREPFVMTTDVWNKCRYCPFRQLCQK